MAENRDMAIKLFGETIRQPAAADKGGVGDEKKVNLSTEAFCESRKVVSSPCSPEEEKNEPNHSAKEEESDKEPYSPEQNKNECTDSLKKPEKILPCPRCNSKDTKFCYYNNYNVNQPRHFCKNCQRYWTAGGSLRNVPVGAGRRKSKCFAATPLYHDPDCFRADLADSNRHPNALQPNRTVLCFDSGAPLLEPAVSALTLAQKSARNSDNGEELSSGTSISALNSRDKRNRVAANSNLNGYLPTPPCFNGTPCPYTWSHPPPFLASAFPIPFYPATACWGVPWLPLTLGKHLREEETLNVGFSEKGDVPKPESCVWVPKSLRFGDHETAAKCSIWESLGFKNEHLEGVTQSNKQLKSGLSDASRVLLRANPAALSRSFAFQENS